IVPETFADRALDAIAIHRQLHILLGDGQAEPSLRKFAADMDSGQAADAGAATTLEGVLELVWLEQTGAPREARHAKAHPERNRLRNQTLAALGATACNDLPATGRSHTGAETMRA